MLIGVKIPKNIMPSKIGLTIIPNNNPNCIHNLFKGRRASAFKSVIALNKEHNSKNARVKGIFSFIKKYHEKQKKIALKKNPNFLFEGNSKFSWILIFFRLNTSAPGTIGLIVILFFIK